MARGTKILIDRLPAHPTGVALMPLIDALRDGPCEISLDASQVQRLDPSALEGLLVIARTQADRGNSFEVDAPSEAYLADVALFGASRAPLGQPIEQQKGTP
ncbi:MAG: STAS domain-containing protein [Pseudomonadota bacterium]